MITGSSPLKGARGFTRLLTLGSREISRDVYKLTRTSIIIKKKNSNNKELEETTNPRIILVMEDF